jgi:release factor glutamine methyltransferase
MPATGLTLGEIVRLSAVYLGERGSPSPRLDAELIIAHGLGLERIDLYTDHERPVSEAERTRLRELIARRARREPVAYVVGRRAFRGLDLETTPAALVPRPETEILVEWALEAVPSGGRVLDWGTGSGAIALALAAERPDLEVVGVDRSPGALELARRNGDRLGLGVEWRHGDGYGALGEGRFDLIVANPPYLTPADLEAAPPELRHEPAEALVAGPTGLEALLAVVAGAPSRLRDRGRLLLEVGAGQDASVAEAMRDAGLGGVETRADLAGVIRVVGGGR